MAALAALGTLVLGVVIGIWLFATDHLVLGFSAMLAAVPIAFGVWVAMGDRRA